MKTIATFIKNPKGTYYEGEDEDEQVLYVLRRSHVTNVGWVLMLILMAFAPVLLSPTFESLGVNFVEMFGLAFASVLSLSWYLTIFGLFLFKSFNWFFNVYIITNKKVVDFDFYGLTYKNIADTPLSNIQDITAKISGPFSMIFNIGDVFIQTAGESREFDFAAIDDPGKVRDIISDLVSEIKQ